MKLTKFAFLLSALFFMQAAFNLKAHELPIIPDDFRCPISSELMCNPVVAGDGRTYERVNIERWFETCNGRLRSPMTNEEIFSPQLYPNYALKGLIETFCSDRFQALYTPEVRSFLQTVLSVGGKRCSVSDLSSPFQGVFSVENLQGVVISTGYRKGRNPSNFVKVEVWILPKCVAEYDHELGKADHLKLILDQWPDNSSICMMFNWGAWGFESEDPQSNTDKNCYDYAFIPSTPGTYNVHEFWEKGDFSMHGLGFTRDKGKTWEVHSRYGGSRNFRGFCIIVGR